MGEQISIHFDLTPGERAAYDACYWVRDNPTAFKRLMSLMHRQVDLGNPCTKQGEIEAYAREMGMSVDVIGEFRHNRNLYPGITRLMVMLRPRLAKTIRFRKSMLDDVDMAAIWHEVVNEGTTFLAKDRREAERLAEQDDVSAA